MKDNTNKITHLKMIHEVIGRFSKNSFTIKSWNITLLTAFLAYSLNSQIKEENILVITIAFTLGFMIIDWYYLNLERSYRDLYKAVARLENDEDVNFQMVFCKKKEEPTITKVKKAQIHYGITRPVIYAFYSIEVIFLLVFLL